MSSPSFHYCNAADSRRGPTWVFILHVVAAFISLANLVWDIAHQDYSESIFWAAVAVSVLPLPFRIADLVTNKT